MYKDDVLIVGGGIGGLTTALALHARGIGVKVFESVKEIKALGVGINLLPHATAVLNDLGLKEELEATAILTSELSYHSKDGKLLWKEPRGLQAGHSSPQYSIHRGALQMVLLKAAQERIGSDKIFTNHHFARYEENSDGSVSAFFVDKKTGESQGSYRGCALIGADGLKSKVRHRFYPTEGPPRFSGLMLWRGIIEREPFLSGTSMVMCGHNTLKAVVYPVSKESSQRGKSLINWVAERRVDPDYQYTGEDWNRKVNKEEFVDYFKEWNFGWLNFYDIICATEDIYEFPMVDRDPVETWTFGKVTLLGDAAHPMYPNGSNGSAQAILDAACLAENLAAEGGDIREKLQRYEDERLPKTAQLVLDNRKTGPERVMQMVEDRCEGACGEVHTCIPEEELTTIANKYKQVAGFSIQGK